MYAYDLFTTSDSTTCGSIENVEVNVNERGKEISKLYNFNLSEGNFSQYQVKNLIRLLNALVRVSGNLSSFKKQIKSVNTGTVNLFDKNTKAAFSVTINYIFCW